jgi:guanine deaminase
MSDKLLFLKKAVDLASTGIGKGQGPFGAVIVRDNQIIAASSNNVVLEHDPTAHAEIEAIRLAAKKLGSHDLSGCELFCSCEPCPMCLGAIYWSGIKQVYYSAVSSDAAQAGFSDKFIYDEMNIERNIRSVVLTLIPGAGGEAVFEKWKEFDGRVAY